MSTDALATKWSVENGRPTKAVAKPFYAALERGADPNLGQSNVPDTAQVRRELPEVRNFDCKLGEFDHILGTFCDILAHLRDLLDR